MTSVVALKALASKGCVIQAIDGLISPSYLQVICRKIAYSSNFGKFLARLQVISSNISLTREHINFQSYFLPKGEKLLLIQDNLLFGLVRENRRCLELVSLQKIDLFERRCKLHFVIV